MSMCKHCEMENAMPTDTHCWNCKKPMANDSRPATSSPAWCEVDEIIETLEKHGLGWSLDHTGNLIEARIWDWPNVVGRYRPNTVEPLVHMLQTAMLEVPKYYWEND